MYDELQHFLLVIEHGTFTAAARHAHLSQPALSASIRRLEAKGGVVVTQLQRQTRLAHPTRAGEGDQSGSRAQQRGQLGALVVPADERRRRRR